jgi:hypothetical protein
MKRLPLEARDKKKDRRFLPIDGPDGIEPALWNERDNPTLTSHERQGGLPMASQSEAPS